MYEISLNVIKRIDHIYMGCPTKHSKNVQSCSCGKMMACQHAWVHPVPTSWVAPTCFARASCADPGNKCVDMDL